MREININLFRFLELSEEAQKNALIWARDNIGDIYCWNAESLQSIRAFCKKYGVTMERYNIGPHEGYDYATNASNDNFRGVRLKHIQRDEWLTGHYIDNDLTYAFHDAFKSTGNALGAFNAALDAGFKTWQEHWEDSYSDESLGDFLDANEYEFTQYGSKWDGE
mgnify:CR=1 FL=1